MQYSNPYSFEKTDVRWQKFLKHLQTVSTKLHGKHWLYTVLCCRFNAIQHNVCEINVSKNNKIFIYVNIK